MSREDFSYTNDRIDRMELVVANILNKVTFT